MLFRILIAAILAWGAPAMAQDIDAETRVKVAMIYNFVRFVDWSGVNALEDGRVDLCLAGEHPIGEHLALLDGKAAGDGVVSYRGLNTPQCDAIFVPERQMAEAWEACNCLTISDGRDFARKHGVIGFVKVDGRLRFVVNIKRARANGLDISSRLLALSETVYR